MISSKMLFTAFSKGKSDYSFEKSAFKKTAMLALIATPVDKCDNYNTFVNALMS